jgi:Na+/H+ antiporter NhaC
MDSRNIWNRWSQIIFKGDPNKEDRGTFTFTRRFHLVVQTILWLGFMVDIIFTPSAHVDWLNDTVIIALILSLFTSVLFIIFGFVYPKINDWLLSTNKSKIGISLNHIVQILFFLAPVILWLFVQPSTENINEKYIVLLIPILLSMIALMMTYPSKKRWGKWTRKTNTELYP